MPYTGEETNKKLGALVVVTEKLVESREEEKKDASFADGAGFGPTPKGVPRFVLPKMGDAGRAGQAEDDAEGTTEPDEEKRNSLLSKMTGFLADTAKEKGKIAKLGLKAFFGTLVFGGFLIALGKFLQSDTFKKATEFIDKTLVPKLKTFYDAFFGPEGGLFKGLMTFFGDKSGIGAIVAGLAVVTALMGVVALKALFSPLTLGLGLLFKGIRGLGRMIPKVPGAPGTRTSGGQNPSPSAPAGSKPGRTKRPRGRLGNLLSIGKLLASKAKKLVTSGGAKTVAKVAGTAAVAGAAVAALPSPNVASDSKGNKLVKSAKTGNLMQMGADGKATTQKPVGKVATPTAPAKKSFNPLKKFPKVGKFLGVAKRIPGLSAVFAISDLISIFSDEKMSTKAKISAGVGVFGGLGASVLGGALGMMLGGPIGAALGGLVGYFGGEMLATGLMQWMLGETVDAFPDSWFLPDINGWMNGSGDATGEPKGSGMPMSKSGSGGSGAGNAPPTQIETTTLPSGQIVPTAAIPQRFDAAPAAAKLKTAKQNKLGLDMKMEFMRSQMVQTGQSLEGPVMGFKDPKKQAEFDKLTDLTMQAQQKLEFATDEHAFVAKGAAKQAAFEKRYGPIDGRGRGDQLVTSGALAGMSEAELKAGFAAEGRSMRKPSRGSMRMGQNKVGTQTADLKAAIQKKLAMAGNTSTAAAATQQGGGNTQITNVTKKDGDVTHMPKSDIRNNKFAVLNRSAYAAGAI